ncbi:MAG: biopolymer transporter ExbD [Betaproteobacteria bacterium]|nr:biopolymer transporter ExbD [Betaproteobacteria bacterium]NBY72206.1 biopolymer transporter ExbD [Betaproteobacteria bacterium]NDD12126.1 biopolymer transporter ExbD [Betaproteobacteria bacterium]
MAFGRMNSNTSGPSGFSVMSDINMTPLVDVLLVLVVLLLVTAPLIAPMLKLDLPKVTAQPVAPLPPSQTMQVVIEAAGQLRVQGQSVTLLQLSESMRRVAQNQPQTELQLSANASVPYGAVVSVLDAAQAAGLNRVAFVAAP